MSGKQAKRYRAMEGRVSFLEAHMSCLSDRCAEDVRRAERAARKREREVRRRETIWRAMFLSTALAALIVLLMLAVVLLVCAAEHGRSAAPAEPEQTAAVCRWVGGEQECAGG